MEFQWKAFGWSLSHLPFPFHGNSHFFPRNSDGNGRNPGASRNDSHGNPWKFRWNSIGILWESSLYILSKIVTTSGIEHLAPGHITCKNQASILQLHHKGNKIKATDLNKYCFATATAIWNVGKRRRSICVVNNQQHFSSNHHPRHHRNPHTATHSRHRLPATTAHTHTHQRPNQRQHGTPRHH